MQTGHMSNSYRYKQMKHQDDPHLNRVLKRRHLRRLEHQDPHGGPSKFSIIYKFFHRVFVYLFFRACDFHRALRVVVNLSSCSVILSTLRHVHTFSIIRQLEQNRLSFFQLEIIWKINLWTKNRYTLNKIKIEKSFKTAAVFTCGTFD